MSQIIAQQEWNADIYNKNADFVPELGKTIMNILAPLPKEDVLDIGCGDGILTKKIQDIGANITGIDNSANLLEKAKSIGIKTHQADAQNFNLNQKFDAIFTNAALHWVSDNYSVIKCVKKHLKPQGRFVGEFGGHGNVAAIITAISAVLKQRDNSYKPQHPWFFPTAEEYSNMLEENGFKVNTSVLAPRPTLLKTGIKGWLNTFANPFLVGIDKSEHNDIINQIEDLLRPSLMDKNGNWTADYVRIRFSASL